MRMDGRPDHIEDYLASLHTGHWFGWSDSKIKIYANLIIHSEIWSGGKDGKMVSNPHSKPSEADSTEGLNAMKDAWDLLKELEAHIGGGGGGGNNGKATIEEEDNNAKP